MSPEDKKTELRRRFAASADGILERIAAETGLSTQEVCDCLPATMRGAVTGAHFIETMADVAGWGPVLLLVHTRDVILEFKAEIPAGSLGHGFFNLSGPGPLSGHLRHDRCAAIYFLKRPFMGLEGLSIVFFNEEGEPMFKIFVARDAKRELLPEQVGRFEALRARLGAV